MSSATEAELAGLFHNAKDASPLRVALEEMGRKQPATPIQTDNSCATGITVNTSPRTDRENIASASPIRPMKQANATSPPTS